MRALVIINERARRGDRYRDVAAAIERGLDVRRVVLDGREQWKRRLDEALREKVGAVIAAGGDGTVSAVVGAMVERAAEATFGAVGLGTSNDFHKPFDATIAGVPYRTDVRTRARRDVGLAVFEDEHGRTQRRIFAVSASIGPIARGNRIFSERTRSSRSAAVAIASAAIEAIVTHANIGVTLDGRRVALTNLSVSKTAWISGCLRYDTDVQPASGKLAVHLCEGMGRLRLLHALFSLSRGRFQKLSGASSSSVERLGIELEQPDDLELDGELVRARKVSFEVLPERLWVCT